MRRSQQSISGVIVLQIRRTCPAAQQRALETIVSRAVSTFRDDCRCREGSATHRTELFHASIIHSVMTLARANAIFEERLTASSS
jgi:hypothetical protein